MTARPGGAPPPSTHGLRAGLARGLRRLANRLVSPTAPVPARLPAPAPDPAPALAARQERARAVLAEASATMSGLMEPAPAPPPAEPLAAEHLPSEARELRQALRAYTDRLERLLARSEDERGGLRDQVRRLSDEVQSLRAEVAGLRATLAAPEPPLSLPAPADGFSDTNVSGQSESGAPAATSPPLAEDQTARSEVKPAIAGANAVTAPDDAPTNAAPTPEAATAGGRPGPVEDDTPTSAAPTPETTPPVAATSGSAPAALPSASGTSALEPPASPASAGATTPSSPGKVAAGGVAGWARTPLPGDDPAIDRLPSVPADAPPTEEGDDDTRLAHRLFPAGTIGVTLALAPVESFAGLTAVQAGLAAEPGVEHIELVLYEGGEARLHLTFRHAVAWPRLRDSVARAAGLDAADLRATLAGPLVRLRLLRPVAERATARA